MPSDAVSSDFSIGTENTFTLGDSVTTIELSPYKKSNRLPNVLAVSIDDKDVCEYYK